ncbi:MAG: M23 family metallopeptidase [Ilumatobacteraceae bacterium]|nr:M23 family metallopeptidase [Ilumatobacteraceae bacterium]
MNQLHQLGSYRWPMSRRTVISLAVVACLAVIGLIQFGPDVVRADEGGISEMTEPGVALQPAERFSLIEQPPPPPPDGKLIFPLDPASNCYILDNFGDARGSSRLHEGLDIMGSDGNSVYAVADGVLTKRYTNTGTAGWGWTLYDEAADVTYKYFHLAEDPNGLVEGDTVEMGDVIGYVGDSGTNANNFHLHFEVRPGEGWTSVAVDPLPLLVVDTEFCSISPQYRA